MLLVDIIVVSDQNFINATHQCNVVEDGIRETGSQTEPDVMTLHAHVGATHLT